MAFKRQFKLALAHPAFRNSPLSLSLCRAYILQNCLCLIVSSDYKELRLTPVISKKRGVSELFSYRIGLDIKSVQTKVLCVCVCPILLSNHLASPKLHNFISLETIMPVLPVALLNQFSSQSLG